MFRNKSYPHPFQIVDVSPLSFIIFRVIYSLILLLLSLVILIWLEILPMSVAYCNGDDIVTVAVNESTSTLDTLLAGQPVVGQYLGDHMKNSIVAGTTAGSLAFKVGYKSGGMRGGLLAAGFTSLTTTTLFGLGIINSHNIQKTIAPTTRLPNLLNVRENSSGTGENNISALSPFELNKYFDSYFTQEMSHNGFMVLVIMSTLILTLLTLFFLFISKVSQRYLFPYLLSINNSTINNIASLLNRLSNISFLFYLFAIIYGYSLAFLSLLCFILLLPQVNETLVLVLLLTSLNLYLAINSLLFESKEYWTSLNSNWSTLYSVLMKLALMKGNWDYYSNYAILVVATIGSIYYLDTIIFII